MKNFFKNLSRGQKIAVVAEVIVAVIVVVVGVFVFSTKDLTPSTDQSKSDTSTYITQTLQLSLKYPYGWKLDTSYATIPGLDRYVGEKGEFFSVDAFDSVSIEEGSLSVLADVTKPFGAKPVVTATTIDGQPARYYTPSKDQVLNASQSMPFGGLIVKFPKRVKIGEPTYGFLRLEGDVKHLESIGNSIEFFK